MAASGKRSVRDVLSWVCVVSLSFTGRLFNVLPCTFHLVWQGRLVLLVQCDWLWSVCRRCAVHSSGCALVRRGRGLSVQSCTCTIAILAQGTSWAVAVNASLFCFPVLFTAALPNARPLAIRCVRCVAHQPSTTHCSQTSKALAGS